MYKDDPGVYYSSHGTPVSETLAREAGFDVGLFARRKLLKDRLAQAQEQITKDLEMAVESRVVVVGRGGFSVVDIGHGRHQLLDPDGELLTPQWLPLEQARGLLDQLVPEDEPKAD
jgi:hypothetical protein